MLAETQLPWNRESSTVIVIVSAKTGEPIKRTAVIRDYFGPPPVVTMKPGESLKGTVRLDEFFGNRKGKDRDLLLFWHYTPQSTDNRKLGKYGGWFEFHTDAS